MTKSVLYSRKVALIILYLLFCTSYTNSVKFIQGFLRNWVNMLLSYHVQITLLSVKQVGVARLFAMPMGTGWASHSTMNMDINTAF